MNGTSVLIKEGDRVIIRPAGIYPVPTAREVGLLLDLFPDGSQMKVAFMLLAVCGLRSAELCTLRWGWFDKDENGDFIRFRHLSYKPMNRKTHTGTNWYFKQLIKPIKAWSPELNRQLKLYEKTAPSYECDRLFSFSKPDSVQKVFTKIRKMYAKGELGSEYACFTDPILHTAYGQYIALYRIHTHGLRSFALTYHYHYTFNKDLGALSKFFGHNDPRTTFQHYVHPIEAIQVNQRWSLCGQFNKTQMKLSEAFVE